MDPDRDIRLDGGEARLRGIQLRPLARDVDRGHQPDRRDVPRDLQRAALADQFVRHHLRLRLIEPKREIRLRHVRRQHDRGVAAVPLGRLGPGARGLDPATHPAEDESGRVSFSIASRDRLSR